MRLVRLGHVEDLHVLELIQKRAEGFVLGLKTLRALNASSLEGRTWPLSRRPRYAR
ncbi:hypothetical protein FBY02_103213 [Pseudomonas sp. SJZ078]|nr:hypothetical protein FBY02_103213 [Pseudomonas sp. SJZ078]